MSNRLVNAFDELKNYLSLNGLGLNNIKMGLLGLTQFNEKGKRGIETVIVSNANVKDILQDYNYDNGYGQQYLFGIILLDNGGWLERREYDGAESWDLKVPPSHQDLINYKTSNNESVKKLVRNLQYATSYINDEYDYNEEDDY